MEIVTKIQLDPNNYRIHSKENKELIKKSLTECGAGRSVLVDKEGKLIAGNGVFEQAKALKIPTKIVQTDGNTLVVVQRTDLATADKKRQHLAVFDNSASDLSVFDNEKIRKDFSIEEIKELGVQEVEISAESPTITEDEVPDADKVETRVKKGDVWQLGEHRLMCGDSTVITDVEKLINGEKADMVFTDPPYGIDVVSNNGKVGADFGVAKKGNYKKVIADDTTETAKDAFVILKTICDKLIIWGGNYFLDFLPPSDGWLIWDKRGESGIRNTFADGEMAYCSFHTPVRIYHQLWNGMIREGEHEKRVHPTQKPIKILSEILKDFSKQNDLVIDLFGGSGSTLIACEQLKRKCYMCEIDEHYCSVIIQRYINLKGNAEDVFLLNQDGTKTKYEDVINAKGRKAA